MEKYGLKNDLLCTVTDRRCQSIVIATRLETCQLSRPLNKSMKLKNNFLISQPKHMLLVLKKNAS